jgi:hypothetical protein
MMALGVQGNDVLFARDWRSQVHRVGLRCKCRAALEH